MSFGIRGRSLEADGWGEDSDEDDENYKSDDDEPNGA
jgi:hypothetical protein